MKAAGIIAEYNPFHNGHKYLIDKTREQGATHIIAVMSGNFVQRGEPAVFKTRERVNACLEGGVDLVLQLPLPYAVSGAQNFARAGVEVLNATGVTDMLCFGTEGNNVENLCEISDILFCGKVDEEIKEQLKTGITYAKARENALAKLYCGAEKIISSPNNILALEYINALKNTGSTIKPTGINRVGVGHDSRDKSHNFASASEIRRMISEGENPENFVPNEKFYENLPTDEMVNFTKYETAVLCKMRNMSASEMSLLPDISEGIENRILSAVQGATTLEELYSLAKTKRYTHARIRRIVLSAFLGLTAEISALPVPYIRVLGFTEKGAELLKIMKETAVLPVVTKAADIADLSPNAKAVYSLECRATDIYNIIINSVKPCGEEKKFIIISKNI